MLVSKILRVLITVHGLVRFKLPPDASTKRALPEAVTDYHRVAMHAHVIGILTVVRVIQHIFHECSPIADYQYQGISESFLHFHARVSAILP